MEESIIIKGARQHNLKNIDVTIPRNQLVVITGLSGSGKSSLAFDTIYAEGQRRYIESLSSYARQFLGQMEKPEVDYIEGLSPSISIDQKSVSRNPRSTVGTVTEIYDYLRVLYARMGHPYCPKCGHKIEAQTVDQMSDMVMHLFAGQSIMILSPVIRSRKGEYIELMQEYIKRGYVKARINNNIVELKDNPTLARYKANTIEIIIDELVIPDIDIADDDFKMRLNEALESAAGESNGLVTIVSDKDTLSLSMSLACTHCDYGAFPALEPRLFSFNSPFGACPTCHGLGYFEEFDVDLVLPDRSKTINAGGLLPWSYASHNWWGTIISSVCRQYKIDEHRPIKDLPRSDVDLLLYGKGVSGKVSIMHGQGGDGFSWQMKFDGIMKLLERRYRDTSSDYIREDLHKYITSQPCHSCGSKRLKPEALSVKIRDKSIADLSSMSIKNLKEYFDAFDPSELEQRVAGRLAEEIKARLQFLNNVGLDYLSLDRASNSLSGGETQRIRLASQIGSGLVGVLYVLDEPSIGLHQRDNERLLDTLKGLRDLGNTVLVIEHDQETMEVADYLIDLGPGAGREGGYLVASGKPEEVKKVKESLTGQYLSGELKIPYRQKRRHQNGKYLTVKGATENNLKNITVKIPLSGQFVCVTGVSGSGKSTLVNEIIYKTLANRLNRAWEKPGKCESIEGDDNLDKVIVIDQSPIGRTPRSNPATYTKIFDIIRELFAATEESRVRGYSPSRFSFNVRGGRCEKCLGDGMLKVEMHFLPDVYIPCDVCNGRRYNRETLQVRYKGKNIADVLGMTIAEAYEFFYNIPKLRDKLKVICDVGLGYIHLGQPATTLSGGEAQRIKLSAELSRRATGRTMYVLDEPTTGLHFHDVAKLLEVLHHLVDDGNTVLVIEHNLDVIKNADYIIDLGPEGGERGGKILAAGTPEMIAGIQDSETGRFLRKVMR